MGKIILLAFALSMFGSNVYAYKTKSYKKKHSLGLKRDREKHKRFLMSAVQGTVTDVAVPASLDLSAKVSHPENQGSCGSCWAFGITKALRSELMLAGKDPGRLAFNYLVNNCGPGPKEWGCEGGDFDAGENFLNGNGPWLEVQDKYTGKDNGKCLGLPSMGTALSYKVVGSPSLAPSFKQLAQAIAAKHMLVVDVAVCGDWESYSSGIFNKNQCGASGINHIVNMNGYNCETSVDSHGNCLFNANGEPINGDGYLIVMNNWGDSWGENGYMRTRAHVDAIADTAMYFEVEAAPAPTPTPSPVPTPTPVPVPVPDVQMSALKWVLCGLGFFLILLLVKVFNGDKISKREK